MEGDGKARKRRSKHQTSPSPASSSSSSSFEFATSLSPTRKTSYLCPADELFYRGQLLPLHLSPRISMVRSIIASSSTSSSSETTTTASRDSTGSSNDSSSFSGDDGLLRLAGLDSARPSSANEEEDDFKKPQHSKKSKYFSLSKFSPVVLRKESRNETVVSAANASSKRMAATAKEVLKKYVRKVKPLCEKLSPKHKAVTPPPSLFSDAERTVEQKNLRYLHSFSGNLRCPRRRNCVASCPTSISSSPKHSGLLQIGVGSYSDPSSMEELQTAIQGAIEHCKNSMVSEFGQRKNGGLGDGC